MARRDQERQGRGGQDEGRDTEAQQGERGRWSRDARGEQSWRPEYDDRSRGGWNQDGDRQRFGPESEQWRDRWQRDQRSEGEYRGDERWSRGPGDGSYGGMPRGRARDEETYGETQRWERTRPDMGGPSYGGGAYAGGSSGGGAYGPGGFGTRGNSPEVWEGVAGSGRAPQWAQEMERSRRTDYSGHGPKGYKRSNERITEDVCDALTRHPDIDARDISVRCEDGEVILSGSVHDRYEKRLAEDTAERVTGVVDVRNEIRVNRSGAEDFRG